MEKSGAWMIRPIYQILFGTHKSWHPSLELAEDQVVISYKMYESDNASDMQVIVDEKLTPGIIIENDFFVCRLL